MHLLESGEMYLETILVLTNKIHAVRSVDIAAEMGYSKPSVSRAMSKLREAECILVDPEGYITLTEKGRGIAEKIYERHLVLTEVIMSLGVDRETAVADACKIEHDISDQTFDRLREWYANCGEN